jgi:Ca-activated chloride channel family protein
MFGGTRLVRRPVEYDGDTLNEIAEITGGTYFNAKNTDRLIDVYDQINKLEEREQKEFEYVEYDEHYLPLVLLALASYLLCSGLAFTLLLRVP